MPPALSPNPPGEPEMRASAGQPSGVPEPARAIDQLQRARLRVTSARIEILHVMLRHPGEYLRPEDVARRWLSRNRLASVSAAYRILAQLAASSVLRRGRTPDGKVVYALPNAGECAAMPLHLPDGRVVYLHDDELLERIKRAALLAGVDVSALDITVVGR